MKSTEIKLQIIYKQVPLISVSHDKTIMIFKTTRYVHERNVNKFKLINTAVIMRVKM